MNALFIFKGYNGDRKNYERFALTVPDGPDDRFGRAKEILEREHAHLRSWSGWFVCLTPDAVYKEL